MELLAVLVGLVLVITPILAILAFSGLRRVESTLQAFPPQDLVSRIYAIEQKLAALEGSQRESAAAPTAEIQGPVGAQTASADRATDEAANRGVKTSAAPPAAREPAREPEHKPQAGAPTSIPARATVFAAAPLHAYSEKQRSPVDLETLIAGRWLNRIGIVALILAVSFFLKYAFDNNWIGPSGRVAIGILIGAAMLPWSHWLLKREYTYFSEGITALGATVLYISIWFGWHYYALFSQTTAFAAMIVVTAVMTAVALGRDSERIALLSLLGGFATPALVSTGKDAEVVLFTYLLILGGSLIAIAARRNWRLLGFVAFLFSQAYFWDWYATFYNSAKLERTILFATLFFAVYATLPILRATSSGRLGSIEFFVIVANGFAYLAALYAMLWPEHRWPLTFFVLSISAAHVAVARLIPATKQAESPAMPYLFAGMALTFATLAIPIRLDGKWMTLALAVEGAVLVWTGLRGAVLRLRQAGYLLLAIAALRVLIFPLSAKQFLFNERFGTYLAVIVCFAAVLFFSREYPSALADEEKQWLVVLAIGADAYALIAISLELWDYFGRNTSAAIDRGLAQHLALSVFWTVYSAILLLAGMKRKSALLRWQALSLFGLVAVKVFLYDSSYLDRFYRILSFLILGLVLLVVSFLYQRKLSRERVSP